MSKYSTLKEYLYPMRMNFKKLVFAIVEINFLRHCEQLMEVYSLTLFGYYAI